MPGKSTIEEIRERFDKDVERFSNLETGQQATMDAPLVLDWSQMSLPMRCRTPGKFWTWDAAPAISPSKFCSGSRTSIAISSI